jgi:hypothetical protein
MILRVLSVALGVLFMTSAPRPGSRSTLPFSYAALDTVLTRYLHEGRVDYGGLARRRGPLERFLAATREAHPDHWPREAQIAFWVNVYNARVLEGVIRRRGLKSVLDVGKTLGVPTLGFFREKRLSAGRLLSLNDIEHDILRKGFQEPRVHFVLNCASASCPALPPRALSGATLDSVLEAATSAFLLDRTKNQIDADSDLRLSSILKWYRADFETAAGSLQAFIQRHWKEGGVIRADAPIRFLDYDWSLNGHW